MFIGAFIGLVLWVLLVIVGGVSMKNDEQYDYKALALAFVMFVAVGFILGTIVEFII